MIQEDRGHGQRVQTGPSGRGPDLDSRHLNGQGPSGRTEAGSKQADRFVQVMRIMFVDNLFLGIVPRIDIDQFHEEQIEPFNKTSLKLYRDSSNGCEITGDSEEEDGRKVQAAKNFCTKQEAVSKHCSIFTAISVRSSIKTWMSQKISYDLLTSGHRKRTIGDEVRKAKVQTGSLMSAHGSLASMVEYDVLSVCSLPVP